MRLPLLDQTNTVVNVVKYDPNADWQPGDGLTLGQEGGEIGDVWNGESYTRPAPQVPPLTVEDFASAIQAHVDATAKSRGYENGFAMSGYVADPEHTFEATPFVIWRGQVWKYAYTELAKVQGGQREVPTIAELIGELPTITWP